MWKNEKDSGENTILEWKEVPGLVQHNHYSLWQDPGKQKLVINSSKPSLKQQCLALPTPNLNFLEIAQWTKERNRGFNVT